MWGWCCLPRVLLFRRAIRSDCPDGLSMWDRAFRHAGFRRTGLEGYGDGPRRYGPLGASCGTGD